MGDDHYAKIIRKALMGIYTPKKDGDHVGPVRTVGGGVLFVINWLVLVEPLLLIRSGKIPIALAGGDQQKYDDVSK